MTDHESSQARMSAELEFVQARRDISSVARDQLIREVLVRNWPSAWGHDMQIIVSDGIDSMLREDSIEFPAFGITLTQEKPEHSPIGGGRFATVRVTDHTWPAVEDAVRRINDWLGLITLLNFGNGSLRWWSFVTHLGGGSGDSLEFDHEHLESFRASLDEMPESDGVHIRQALYWLRNAAPVRTQSHRMDSLRQFEMYWNAFECAAQVYLVRAPLLRDEAQILNDLDVEKELVGALSQLSIKDVERLAQIVRHPSQRDCLQYALVCCFSDEAEHHAEISALLKRLLKFRNKTKHAKVEAELNRTLIEGELLLDALRYLVLEMVYRLLGKRGFGGWSWIGRFVYAPG